MVSFKRPSFAASLLFQNDFQMQYFVNASIEGDMSSVIKKQAKRRFSENLHQINALCLQKQPHDRPSAAQLLTHPFLKLYKKGLYLPDLLKPAVPMGEKVAFNPGLFIYYLI